MSSKWVQQAEDSSRGRHLVASVLINPGTCLLSQPAVAWVLYDDHSCSRCHWSLQLVSNPLRCGNCKHARYVSKQSQREAWAAGHKEECAALAACFPKVPPPTVRLVARLFWLEQRMRVGRSAASGCGSFQEVTSLQHHWEELPDSKKELFAQMAALTRRYMQGNQSDETQLPDVRNIALMLARCACNNHTICDDELRPIGVGLYPMGALINHSSTPNAMQRFQGQQIQFKALQPIEKGSEVTISYIELAATRAEQRQQLLAQYYFDIVASKEPNQQSLVSCQTGTVSAELFPEALGARNAADDQLTAVTSAAASGRSDAHVMAYIHTEQSSDIQASFPHNSLHSSQHQDDVEALHPISLATVSQDPQGNGALLANKSDSAIPLTKEQHVQVQCWGKGLTDMCESQLQALAQGMSSLLQQHKQCEALLTSGQPDQAQALALSALQLASSLPAPVQALGEHHIWRMRLNEVLLRACIASGNNWPLALSVAEKLRPVYEVVYPKVWPLKGLHFAAMSKIAALLEKNDVAAATATVALQQLQHTHADSRVLDEMRQILFESHAAEEDRGSGNTS